ncbi:MAG TPA: bifunctional serine/threonine-protein kinase/formylglycine-generating enzyme family protein [Polyangium sp.]|nr:bifunctional serine/threonine-protein kinase/formylglycine-generating enzyme family protein [Polyangium sp.]
MSATHNDPFAWVGQTIDGKFRVEEVVGEGGFGVVYRAQHLGLGESVAVKCLKIPPALSPEERDKFHQSFLEEGRILRRLSRTTAAVVQALDVGAAFAPNGAWAPYLVLEWLRGECLEDHLVKLRQNGPGKMPLADAVALLEPAALAIAAAHDEGVAHRDIKPANFYTTDVDGVLTMKVLDFGIAKVIADNASITRAFEQTGKAPSMFTPFYGAPEQFNRRFGATGPWTDVFALALVLVEMVSGQSPLEGDDVTQLYIAATDITIRPTPRTRGVRTSQAVEDVFQKALAVEPRARYTSARTFWDELKGALAQPIEEAQDDTVPDAPLPQTVVSRSDSNRTTNVTGRNSVAGNSSRRMILAIAGSLAILGAFAGASLYVRHRALLQSVNMLSRIGIESIPEIQLAQPPENMVLIPAGSFTMGNNSAGETEKPAHTVIISKPFFLDRTEVTAAQYNACVAAGKCTATSIHGPGETEAIIAKFSRYCTTTAASDSRKPINCVDFYQAREYCAFVGKRLPTEAEWEYAARGSDERTFPWGNAKATCNMGNFGRHGGDCTDRGPGVVDVGSFPQSASPFGALDMAGNVWEWVADAFDPKAYSEASPQDPFVNKPNDKGVMRGGSWDFNTGAAKSTYRLKFDRRIGEIATGVRCAKPVQ